jgi:hypothetical protein
MSGTLKTLSTNEIREGLLAGVMLQWGERMNDKISTHPGGDVFEDESELVSRDAALAVLLVVVHTVSTLCRCHVKSWSPGLVTSNC